MSILRSQCLVIGLLTLFAGVAATQTKKLKIEPVKPTMSQTGEQFFHEFCAACHGVDGKGNGPATAALKTKPSDLTQISKRHNNKFPTIEIRSAITSGSIAAHGNTDMPTWGDAFKSISANSAVADMRINSIVSYIEKLQQ